jgi:L-alanine-DL-glutamate epimerase-like enolase superfamily enzyme
MFGPAEAAYLGHALESCRLYFYEDPIRALNPLSLRHVRDKVNLPIATGEQLAHKWEFQPLIENELVDYLRIDLVHAGGITGYVEMPNGPGLGVELDEAEARRRPSRDAPLPSRFWPDGGVADY